MAGISEQHLTPVEVELAHSINPDQMVIEGLASEFDPFHQQFEPIKDEEATELAVDALVRSLNLPQSNGAWHQTQL